MDAETWKFAKKVHLTSLKCEVDKLDIDKLIKVPTHLNSLKSNVDKLDDVKQAPVSVDLGKLSDVVKNNVVKKAEYDELIKIVKATQTNDTIYLVKKTDYDTKVRETEKKLDHDHSNKYFTTEEFN